MVPGGVISNMRSNVSCFGFMNRPVTLECVYASYLNKLIQRRISSESIEQRDRESDHTGNGY